MTDKDKEIQTLRRELEKEREISRLLYAKLCTVIAENGSCSLCQRNPMQCEFIGKSTCSPTPRL